MIELCSTASIGQWSNLVNPYFLRPWPFPLPCVFVGNSRLAGALAKTALEQLDSRQFLGSVKSVQHWIPTGRYVFLL